MQNEKKFCCKQFEQEYKIYNNYPNIRVVRYVSKDLRSNKKEIRLPSICMLQKNAKELWEKNRMTGFIMSDGYRLFEFPKASPKYRTLYRKIFYCPYCGRNLYEFYGPHIDEYVQETEGKTFPLVFTRHDEYMRNDYSEMKMLGIYVRRIYTEWRFCSDNGNKELLRIYVCFDFDVNSISCLGETVLIRENVDLPEKQIAIENENSYCLQEEKIEWLGESPILDVKYLYEPTTGIKRGICLFFKEHHIVYYNPSNDHGDRGMILYDVDIETIKNDYELR